jgi:regulator of sigma E protease
MEGETLELIGFILSIMAGLLILVFLVVIHELGHGIVARRNGVTVEEFGVGFPPLAWGKKVKNSILGKNVLFSVNWLPIGGFVKLKGEYDAASKEGDYGAATFWQKTKIILAGVATNWVAAAVIFTILAFIGLPRLIPGQFYVESDVAKTYQPLTVVEVTEGLPAALAGFRAGDEIKSVHGIEGDIYVDQVIAYSRERPGEPLTVTYVRDGKQYTVQVPLRTAEQASDGKGYLGVQFGQMPTTYRSTWSAPVVGIGVTAQLSVEIIKGLGDLLYKVFTGLVGNLTGDKVASQKLGEAGDSVAGPVGIVGQILPGAVSAGIVPVLLITAILSVTLAVMNILPIPALDGGRWYLMALFKVLKKPLTKEIEERINSYGMIFLLGLIAVITVTDVVKLF